MGGGCEGGLRDEDAGAVRLWVSPQMVRVSVSVRLRLSRAIATAGKLRAGAS